MASIIMNRTWTRSTRQLRAEQRPVSIICPIDFSERDTAALRYAARVASQRHGKLIVVHVLPSSDGVEGALSGDVSCEHALTRLEQMVPCLPGVQCEWVVLQGDVAGQILELAAGCEAPQIVMASRRRRGLGSAPIGEAAVTVLRRAACPVVMVNDDNASGVERSNERSHFALAAS